MRTLIRELFETVILALSIFLLLQLSIQNFRVEGPSMRPTLQNGEYVLVNKLVYTRLDPRELFSLIPFVEIEKGDSVYPFHGPQRGEVIIFHFPGDPRRDFVKRVIGLENEVVAINNGQVIVDGVPLDEPYITHFDDDTHAAYTVPPDSYYVMGDNRRASNDSRDWKAVPAENVVGRAWVSFWPFDRWHTLGIGR